MSKADIKGTPLTNLCVKIFPGEDGECVV